MKTAISLTLLRKTKSYVSYSVLLFVSVSLIASTGFTQVLQHPLSAANTRTPADTVSATISLGASVFPQSVVISPDSKAIYVASQTSDGSIISVVDSQTKTVTTTIPLGTNLWVLAITPDGSTLYASDFSVIYVISTASNTVTTTLNVPGTALAVSPNGQSLYVTNGKQGISIIDTATNQVDLNAIKPRGDSEPIALNPDGKTAYVGLFESVVAIDLVTKRVRATIPLPFSDSSEEYLVVKPNGKKLFINYEYGRPRHNYILVVDTSTNTVTKTIRTRRRGTGSSQDAITPDGKYLYIPFAGGEVLVLDTTTNARVDTINAGLGEEVAVAPTAPFACTIGISGDNDEGELYVIDISSEDAK
jgi:YVTN family beta-propeller protein